MLEQSILDFQLIAILDGPSAEIEAIVAKFFPQARNIHIAVASGIAVALNTGLELSTADYIARIDADDMMEPTRLELQRDFLDANRDCLMVSSAVTIIDKLGFRIRGRVTPIRSNNLNGRLKWRNPIAHPSAIFRREAVAKLGGYSTSANFLEDYILWLALATRGEIAELPVTLTKYRVHGGQLTNSVKFEEQGLKELRKAKEALARSKGESVTASRLRHQLWCSYQFFRGRM